MAVLLACLGGLGCKARTEIDALHTAPTNGSATDFLKWSMDRYHSAKHFKAKVNWSARYGAGSAGPSSTREISYSAPNKFKVISTTAPSGFLLTCVSDGQKLVEYANSDQVPAMTYTAPDSIAAANSMQMQHPMFCGTLLYAFFGGSANIDKLVDKSKGAVSFGVDRTAGNGEPGKEVKFFASGLYGHTTVLIGKKSGSVLKIQYDSEPLMMLMKDKAGGMKSTTSETYSDIDFNPTFAADAFVAVVPSGKNTVDMQGTAEGKPPVAFGLPAPEFSLQRLSDKNTTRLSDFKGKVILIDFWATWCGPCREALPKTESIYKDLHAKGLEVVAVSDEDQATISSFVKKQGYTMPVYRDVSHEANKAYGIEAIPTTVIIDRTGKLSAFFVGERPEEVIRDALKKAGI